MFMLFAMILMFILESPLASFSTTAVQAQETAGWETMSEQCQSKLFPIVAGGTSDEYVSCTVNDPVNEFILVAGNTTSKDFAPAANDHAFVYAIDYNGNWRWGKFFYNESFAIASISGCQIDDNGDLVVIGIANSYPVVLVIQTADGSVSNFFSLDKIGTVATNIPRYYTFGGIHHDVADKHDGKSYFYASFIMDDYLVFVKVKDDGGEMEIDYSYSYFATDDGTYSVNWPNFKVPGFLSQDPNDDSKLFYIGQFNNRATVMHLRKKNMRIEWKVEIEHETDDFPASRMHEILSYVQPSTSSSIFGCGYRYEDAEEERVADMIYHAAIIKISDNGQVQFLYTFDDEIESYDSSTTNDDGDTIIETYSDICRAVNYDDQRNEIVFVMEVQNPNLRPSYDDYSDYSDVDSDIFIMVMKESGSISGAYIINQYDASVSMGIGTHSMFILDSEVVFAGQSYGYNTLYQNVTYDEDEPYTDSYLFKYDVNNPVDCFYQDEMRGSEVKDLVTKWSHSDVVANDDNIKFGKMNNYFYSYSAKYNGHFDLLNSFNYPKMCLQTSGNLTDGVSYYRGQNEFAYVIGKETSYGGVPTSMDNGAFWMFENGTSAEGAIGRFDKYDNGGTFYIKTDNEVAEGSSFRTILRGCSRFNELLELYLLVEIVANTAPDFTYDPETSWTLAVGDVINYQLPPVEDDEDNDEVEVYVMQMDKQEYPPFLFYDNSSRVISFRPESEWLTGNKYYFIIMLKEKNSDFMTYPVYCTVRISGVKKDPLDFIEWTNIYMTLSSQVDRNSSGTITWSHPVDTVYIRDNFDQMFDIYIRNVTYKYHKSNYEVEEFVFTELEDDNMTMHFQAKFHEPYLLGLLVKKRDTLYLHWKHGLLNTTGQFTEDKQEFAKMFVAGTNLTETKLFVDTCDVAGGSEDEATEGDEEVSNLCDDSVIKTSRIQLQFDPRDPYMDYMRTFAVKIYWYLCAAVWLQFAILMGRGVGFFPLWTVIEYMQLVAFIPLYNFRLIPYLYDAFKPMLVSHLVLTNESHVLTSMQDDYFNDNYDYYKLNVAKLGQALVLIVCCFLILILLNIVFLILYLVTPKKSGMGIWVGKNLSQFKFNAYIRFYMLTYFDLTFFSVMKLVEGNDTTDERRMATDASYIIFVLSVVVPVFLMTIVCSRFEVLKIKQAKESFNTLVLKIDKQSRWRLIQPGYFFFRRLLTAMLLSIPLDSPFIFLQYVFILMSSHIYVLYLVAMKPYQSPMINNYVIANETFYSALIIAVFIFSDSTPELDIKIGAGVVLISSVFLLIFANFVMVIAMCLMGRDRLKKQIKQAKLKRAEKELMEEEEEEERTLRQRRQEEDFSKLHDEATNLSHYDMTDLNSNNQDNMSDMMGEGKPTKKGKKKGKKNKNKNNNDELTEYSQGGNAFDTINGGVDTQAPLKGKKVKKKKKDKKKNKQDDVSEVSIAYAPSDQAAEENPSGSDKEKNTKGSSAEQSESSSDKKKDKDKKDKKKKKNKSSKSDRASEISSANGDGE